MSNLNLESTLQEEEQKIVPDKVLNRRSKVAGYLQLNAPIEKISKALDVHYDTIVRDKAWLKVVGFKWGNEQAQGAFLADCMIQLSRIELTIQDLVKDYGNSKRRASMRKIGRELREACKLKLEITDNVPMYHQYSEVADKIGSQELQDQASKSQGEVQGKPNQNRSTTGDPPKQLVGLDSKG